MNNGIEKKVVFVTDNYALQQLLARHYPILQDYSVAAGEDAAEGTILYLNVPDTWSSYNQQDWDRIARATDTEDMLAWTQYRLELLLSRLVHDGYMYAGEYYIHVS